MDIKCCDGTKHLCFVFLLIFDLDGIWLAIVAAEAMALILSFAMLKVYKKKYGY